MKYICYVCGYVYDPKEGDLIGAIDHGTLFENLPDHWYCPLCGCDKSEFAEYVEE